MSDSGLEEPAKTLLEQLPFAAHIEHAYTLRETALYGGADHIVGEKEGRIGLIHRRERDALCKPRDRFWGLNRGGEDHVSSCWRCTQIAAGASAAPESVKTSAGGPL